MRAFGTARGKESESERYNPPASYLHHDVVAGGRLLGFVDPPLGHVVVDLHHVLEEMPRKPPLEPFRPTGVCRFPVRSRGRSPQASESVLS